MGISRTTDPTLWIGFGSRSPSSDEGQPRLLMANQRTIVYDRSESLRAIPRQTFYWNQASIGKPHDVLRNGSDPIQHLLTQQSAARVEKIPQVLSIPTYMTMQSCSSYDGLPHVSNWSLDMPNESGRGTGSLCSIWTQHPDTPKCRIRTIKIQ